MLDDGAVYNASKRFFTVAGLLKCGVTAALFCADTTWLAKRNLFAHHILASVHSDVANPNKLLIYVIYGIKSPRPDFKKIWGSTGI